MGKIKKETRMKVYDKFNGKCAYCGFNINYEDMQVDHIKPLYRKSTQYELDKYNILKGVNNITNFNPSCKSCNCSKSTFTLEKWREEIRLKVYRLRRDVSSFRIAERFNQVTVNDIEVFFYFEKEVNNE